MRKCEIWWCDKKHYANGYCKAHDTADKRYGSPYGRHSKQMQRIDDLVLKARLVAVLVTDFVEIKPVDELDKMYTWETKDITTGCPFCDGVREHKPLCIVMLSRSILDEVHKV